MSHRSNTEAYIVHFINSNNYFNVIEAAKCAHALQQVILNYLNSYFICWIKLIFILLVQIYLCIHKKTICILFQSKKNKALNGSVGYGNVATNILIVYIDLIHCHLFLRQDT